MVASLLRLPRNSPVSLCPLLVTITSVNQNYLSCELFQVNIIFSYFLVVYKNICKIGMLSLLLKSLIKEVRTSFLQTRVKVMERGKNVAKFLIDLSKYTLKKLLPYYKHFSSKKKGKGVNLSLIYFYLLILRQHIINLCINQSIKHLEPFKFYKAEDIPEVFYFPSLALGWLLLPSAGILSQSKQRTRL